MATRYRLFRCQFKGTLNGKIQSALSVAYLDPEKCKILTLNSQDNLTSLIFHQLQNHGLSSFDLNDQQPQTACLDVPEWHEFQVTLQFLSPADDHTSCKSFSIAAELPDAPRKAKGCNGQRSLTYATHTNNIYPIQDRRGWSNGSFASCSARPHLALFPSSLGSLTPSTSDSLREGLKEILDDETKRQRGKAWF